MTKSAEKPTLFIIINIRKAVRNFGKGGFLEAFIKRGYHCVLFGKVDPHVQDGLVGYFGDDVSFEKHGLSQVRGLSKIVQRLETYTWRSRIDYNAVLTRHLARKTPIHYFQHALGVLLRPVPVSFWEWIEEITGRWPAGKEMIRKYNPKGLILVEPVAFENAAVNFAKRRGIYTACLIESWDNLTIRGGVHAHHHDLFVWGDLMGDEAIDHHKFPKDRVHPIGLPSFDLYWKLDLYPSEEEWRRQNGIPEGVPVINYSSSPKIRYGHQDMFVKAILEARDAGKLPRNTIILVRTHRDDEQEDYDWLLEHEGVILQSADACVEGMEPGLGQPLMLAATMRYSNVVINLFSTTVLDAMINGSPVVAVAYDPREGEGGIENLQVKLKRFLNDKHIKDLLTFDAILIARSDEDLVAHTAACIADRDILLENRRKCLEHIFANLDGTSTELFVDTYISQMERFYEGKHPYLGG